MRCRRAQPIYAYDRQRQTAPDATSSPFQHRSTANAARPTRWLRSSRRCRSKLRAILRDSSQRNRPVRPQRRNVARVRRWRLGRRRQARSWPAATTRHFGRRRQPAARGADSPRSVRPARRSIVDRSNSPLTPVSRPNSPRRRVPRAPFGTRCRNLGNRTCGAQPGRGVSTAPA